MLQHEMHRQVRVRERRYLRIYEQLEGTHMGIRRSRSARVLGVYSVARFALDEACFG